MQGPDQSLHQLIRPLLLEAFLKQALAPATMTGNFTRLQRLCLVAARRCTVSAIMPGHKLLSRKLQWTIV